MTSYRQLNFWQKTENYVNRTIRRRDAGICAQEEEITPLLEASMRKFWRTETTYIIAKTVIFTRSARWNGNSKPRCENMRPVRGNIKLDRIPGLLALLVQVKTNPELYRCSIILNRSVEKRKMSSGLVHVMFGSGTHLSLAAHSIEKGTSTSTMCVTKRI